MSSNLYRNTMAFTGEVPWHRLGIQFNEKMNSTQALHAAELDYKVWKEPLYRIMPYGMIEHCGMYATVNDYNEKQLGVVGERYNPIQNIDAFQFFDSLVEEDAAIYETAGALGNGEKVWILAKLPQSFSVLQGDNVECYCLLYNSHDGTTPLSVMFTPIRVVCQNTLNMALNNKKTQQLVKIRHTIGADDRLSEAGRIMKYASHYFNQIGEDCYKLSQFTLDDKFIVDFKDLMFGKEEELPAQGPAKALRANKIELFEKRLQFGKGVEIPGVSGTPWHIVNAAVEMADYDLPKVGKDPTESVLFGSSAEFKQKAWDAAFTLMEVRS